MRLGGRHPAEQEAAGLPPRRGRGGRDTDGAGGGARREGPPRDVCSCFCITSVPPCPLPKTRRNLKGRRSQDRRRAEPRGRKGPQRAGTRGRPATAAGGLGAGWAGGTLPSAPLRPQQGAPRRHKCPGLLPSRRTGPVPGFPSGTSPPGGRGGAGVRTCVPGQLAAHTHVALAGLQVVDGADVVQAAAGHVVPRGGVGAGHDPGGAQGDGVHLEPGRQACGSDLWGGAGETQP